MLTQRIAPVQQMKTYRIASLRLLEEIFDPSNPRCPYHGYIGNEEAVRLAIRAAKKAFESIVNIGTPTQPVLACNRENPIHMLLAGPRSVGKTTFARKYAKLVGTNYDTGEMTMPWVEVDASEITKREDVLEKIAQAMRECGIPMVPWKTAGSVRYYKLPPLTLFVDEMHLLPRKVKEGWLKMTEPSDGIFDVGHSVVDCRRIAIIGATTNVGEIPATLKSRFPLKITLRKHSLDQVADMIAKAEGWPKAQAMRLARMKPIPREALEIAKMITTAKKQDHCSLDEAIDVIARDLGLAEDGLSLQALQCMKILADAHPYGLSRVNLCAQMDSMDVTTFQQEVVPQLLANSEHPAFISISSRHKLTDAGLDELRARGLAGW